MGFEFEYTYQDYEYVSENTVGFLFRDGNGIFKFSMVMYYPDNGQTSYKPQSKHPD